MTSLQDNVNLRQIVNELSENHYSSLEALSERIIIHVQQRENKINFAEYLNHCAHLCTEVKAFIVERREAYLPYLNELSEKNTTGHDCANCSGRCDMQHNMRMLELTATLKKMKDTTSYIQKELDVFKNLGELKWLSNEMQLLINMLDDFFIDEETLLIPAIENAQKSINAHS